MCTITSLLTTRSGVAYNISRVSLSDDNFRKPRHTKFIFAHPVYFLVIQVKFVYKGHHRSKGQKSLFMLCKTSTGNNSGSIKHRTIKFACVMGFLDTAD